MKLIIELEKNAQEEDWGAYAEIGGKGFDGVGSTPEQACISLLAFPEVKAELKQEKQCQS